MHLFSHPLFYSFHTSPFVFLLCVVRFLSFM